VKQFAEGAPQNARAYSHLAGHPRDASLHPYTLAWRPLAFFTWATTASYRPSPFCQKTSSAADGGLSLDQRGLGSLHSAGEGNGINLKDLSDLNPTSPQTQRLCTGYNPPPTVLTTSAQKTCYTEITTANRV